MEHYATLLSFGPDGWGMSIAWGLLVTISLAIATLPVGLALGFLVALGKQSQEPSIRLASNIYTTIFRGLPELLTLFLVYFGASLGLQRLLSLFGVDANVEINASFSHPIRVKSSCPHFVRSRAVNMRAAMQSVFPIGRPCAKSCFHS
jgi:polar amino acid transport system permease protein